MSGYTVPLAEVGVRDTASVGGKSASLGELTRAGVPVPSGFALTTAAFREAMSALDPGGARRARIARLDPGDLDAATRATAELRDRIGRAPLPPGLRDAVIASYRGLDTGGGSAPVAVRSSATSEDGAGASFAGLQDTYLWVRGGDPVLGYVRRCWASLYNVASVVYRRRRELPEEHLAMGVVIQSMVDARCAGVVFTRSPLTGDRSVVVIEAAWGLGSALVGGDVTPDRFVVNKVTGETVERAVATKLRRHRMDPAGAGVRDEDVPVELRDACCLTDAEIGGLVTVARRVERHYGAPQDIEFAVPERAAGGVWPGDHPFVLQSRPETVWANRDTAPLAAPRARAFDHVLDRLGRSGTAAG